MFNIESDLILKFRILWIKQVSCTVFIYFKVSWTMRKILKYLKLLLLTRFFSLNIILLMFVSNFREFKLKRICGLRKMLFTGALHTWVFDQSLLGRVLTRFNTSLKLMGFPLYASIAVSCFYWWIVIQLNCK